MNEKDKKEYIFSNFGYWFSSKDLLYIEKLSKEVNGTLWLSITM